MSHLAQNSLEINRPRNNPNEGHNRIIPLKAMTLKPKPLHPLLLNLDFIKSLTGVPEKQKMRYETHFSNIMKFP